ncbi:MAG: rod shape-determining protein MreD [Ignavibacteria bacterium]|jgi:rod shape-determining protein MreD
MNNFQKYILPLIIFIPLGVIQLTLIPLMSVDFIVPDLIIIYLVYLTLKNGQIYGTVYGFVFGFLFDLISGGLLGSSMFAKTLSAFVAGFFYKEKKLEENLNVFTLSFIVLISAFINSVFYSLIGANQIPVSFFSIVFIHGFLPAVYTTFISFPLSISGIGRRFI